MDDRGNLLIITTQQQYYLRVFAVIMTVLIGAQWYRINNNSSYNRDIYLIIIPLLIYGLYFDHLHKYSPIILFMILILFIYIAFV